MGDLYKMKKLELTSTSPLITLGHILCQIPHRPDVTELGLHLKTLLAKSQTSLSFVVSSIDDGSGTETEQALEPFTLGDVELMIQSIEAFKKPLSFKVKLGPPMRIYLQFAGGFLNKPERHLISGFPRCPRHLRRMAPMQGADISALLGLTAESNTPEPEPVEHTSVNWSKPDLQRYPDPETAHQPRISRAVSM